MSATRRQPGAHHRGLMALVPCVALAGCAGVYRVDNQVESFARWSEAAAPAQANSAAPPAPAPPQHYRFERLPSQASGAAAKAQTELETLTERALAPLGWTPATEPASAPWTVQVRADHQRLPRAPWEDPWDDGRFGWSSRVYIGVSSGHVMWSPGFMWSPGLMRSDMPYHLRRISLIIRDARRGQVVFETSAAHDGRWNSTPALWGAMLNAALQDFPLPPAGVREIPVDVAR